MFMLRGEHTADLTAQEVEAEETVERGVEAVYRRRWADSAPEAEERVQREVEVLYRRRWAGSVPEAEETVQKEVEAVYRRRWVAWCCPL